MVYRLNSLKGVIGDYIGEYCRVVKADTTSLDCSSYGLPSEA